MNLERFGESVLLACPDARPPAYQAAVGLHRAGMLHGFVTGYYYDPASRLSSLLREIAPGQMSRLERVLLRRHEPEIPSILVKRIGSFDLLLRIEGHLSKRLPQVARVLARGRTAWFDAQLARIIKRDLPEVLLAFSDVGSTVSLPVCRRLGIKTIVSMVHGDVREEQELFAREERQSPEYMPIYLGSSSLDRTFLAWLHARRLQDLVLADRILVPSSHIASELVRHGTPEYKIRVIPYAADCCRFKPARQSTTSPGCTFLFAGGISHRKGIKYLLEAWQRVRRAGWRLQLLGPLPAHLEPLEPYLNMVETLGQVSQSEMPARMAAADVFVFPSLFEGSAVVTYEALASGLPCIVTPSAGSVVRDGVEGFLVPPSQVDELAYRMAQLGADANLRTRMSTAARSRALEFDWPRYHQRLALAVNELLEEKRPVGHVSPEHSSTSSYIVSKTSLHNLRAPGRRS